MSDYGDGWSVEKIVKWLLIGIAAIVALRLGVFLLALLLRVGFVALLKIGPILLVGWLVLRLLRHFSRDSGTVTS
jgi:hypothetical protein